MPIWNGLIAPMRFEFQVSVFSSRMNSNCAVHAHGLTIQETKCTFQRTYTHFIQKKKNIKNGSHGTTHTFKNYFVTVFSIFSF